MKSEVKFQIPHAGYELKARPRIVAPLENRSEASLSLAPGESDDSQHSSLCILHSALFTSAAP
jgi:hypothetical protein